MPLIYLYHANLCPDLWKSDLHIRPTVFNVQDHVSIFVAHAIYYLTCASIKGVVYELQLPYKSHFCRKLNDMKKTLVLQTPHMEKSRSGQLHVQRKIYHYSFLSSDLEMALKNDYNYMQIDRSLVIYKCTKFLHSKSNMRKTCKS